jgi:adenine phosphoribosyltransferase
VTDSTAAGLDARLRAAIREVPDFPKPGISFKDITPVLADGQLVGDVIRELARQVGTEVDLVVGIESRGFIFGAPLAHELGCGFVPVRKPGKLPWQTRRVEYALEYGTDALEAHIDALVDGARVALVDDVLATGGTAVAAGELIRQLGGRLVGMFFAVELGFLGGRSRLEGVPVHSLVNFE